MSTSCASLPAIAPNVCGNHVLDPGEDCDTFPNADGSTQQCIPTGGAAQCHFACDLASGSPSCPPGFSCGAAGVCRKPTGQFDSHYLTVQSEPAHSFLVGDFDGDQAPDIVATGPTSTRIHFFDGRSVAQQVSLASSTDSLALGSLASDGRTSAVVVTPPKDSPTSNGSGGYLRVWRGASDRTLLPTIYASVSLPNISDGRAMPVFVGPTGGTELLALVVPTAGPVGIYYLVGSQLPVTPLPMFTSPTSNFGAISDLTGEIPIGVLGSSACNAPTGFNLCENVVLAFKNQPSVTVYPVCDNAGALATTPTLAPRVFNLPNDTVNGRAFLVRNPSTDVNELIVVGVKGVYRFATDACGQVSAGSAIAELPTAKTDSILAVDYIDSNVLLDWVDPNGIHVNDPKQLDITTKPPYATGTGVTWTDARIGDFNLNGLTDVVALSSDSLDFYNGSGSPLLNGQHVSLDGTGELLAVGDFDGDFIRDFAITTNGDSTGLPSKNLLIAFGQFTGFVEAPASVGRLADVEQIVPAYFDYRLNGVADFIGTLFAVGRTGTNITTSILQGSPDRLIDSPFILGSSGGGIVAATIGNFLSDPKAPHTGLAGIAETPTGPLLWAAPATYDAQLDPSQVVTTNVALTIDLTQLVATVAAIDVGGAPGDELIVFAPATGVILSKAYFAVASMTAQGFQPPALETIDKLFALRTAPPLVTDLDGDGKQDLLVAFRTGSIFGKATLRAVFNDQSGSLSLAAAPDIAVPDGTFAMTVVHTTATGDPGTSIVVRTREGLFWAQITGRTVGTFTELLSLPLADTDAGLASGDAKDQLAVTVADVDGDGVEDLIVGVPEGFRVYFGIARDP